MDLQDILVHLLNFVAPAFWLACSLPLLGRTLFKPAARRSWWMQCLIVFLIGVTTLSLALWLTGRDAKMVSYAALILACGSAQWLLLRRPGR